LSLLSEEAGLEDALTQVLVDFIEAVDTVKAVRNGREIKIELGGVRVSTDYLRVNECLGSYPVSIAGCVLSQVLGTPICYRGEEDYGDKKLAFFEVMNIG
jgi:hypothetical protein